MEILAKRESIGRRETDLLFGIIEACYVTNVSSPPERLIIPQFAELIPHETFIHARVDPRHDHLCREINILASNEPASRRAYLDGVADCPLIRQWLVAHEPVYCENVDYTGRPLGPEVALVGSTVAGTDMVVHGVMEPDNVSASCYALMGLQSPWSARQANLLQRLAPHLNAALFRGTVGQAKLEHGRNPLTAREIEVLHWIAKGKSDMEIGLILGISVHTVHIHVRNITRKLNSANRTHAVMKAVQCGLIDARLGV